MLMIATPKLPIFRSLIARPAENCSRGGEQLTLAGEDEAAAAALLEWCFTPSQLDGNTLSSCTSSCTCFRGVTVTPPSPPSSPVSLEMGKLCSKACVAAVRAGGGLKPAPLLSLDPMLLLLLLLLHSKPDRSAQFCTLLQVKISQNRDFGIIFSYPLLSQNILNINKWSREKFSSVH